MARFAFRLPDIGEGVAEAEIVKWHVKPGDEVSEGQAFVDVMTDKAMVEISAPVSGTLRTRNGEEGAKFSVGAELAVFETEKPENTEAVSPSRTQVKPAQAILPIAASRSVGKSLAAPAVRARAKSLNIDLAQVKGSGPEGRIVHADLDATLSTAKPVQPAAQALPPLPVGAEDIKVFGLRRRIAERMLEAKRRIPHFAYVEEVDVTALEDLRSKLNTKGAPHLTVLPFIIRAIARVLPAHPNVNSHYDETNGILRRFKPLHAGIATQTDRGLLVPVIRNAEAMNLRQLAEAIGRLSGDARAGKSHRDELSGSTLTVTSLGALGGIMATPIINPPEVAIIGVNKIGERPCVIAGTIEVRKIMNLSSCFDHRIVDGHQAAAFIAEVKKALEHPQDIAD